MNAADNIAIDILNCISKRGRKIMLNRRHLDFLRPTAELCKLQMSGKVLKKTLGDTAIGPFD
jgi:hypothetical protein